MRHTEFWVRLERALGKGYARSWADLHVMSELANRTAAEALAEGVSPKEVWAAVWAELELSPSDR